jgi:hypothetical protein
VRRRHAYGNTDGNSYYDVNGVGNSNANANSYGYGYGDA